MPRGGARVNSGPPPDPNALRRDRKEDKQGWTLLPAGGRKDPAPKWPLVSLVDELEDSEAPDRVIQAVTEREAREQDLWGQLWATPQAVVWERLGWSFEVAMYVRLLAAAERSADTKSLAEARMWSDRLGLNPAAMLRNRWKIADDEVAQRRQPPSGTGTKRGSSVRERALRAVSPDGGA